MKYKLIIILSACIATAALALAITAFRLARHEGEYRKNEVAKLLNSECRKTADICRELVERQKEFLIGKLRISQTNPEALLKLQMEEPLINQVFLADKNGNLIFPKKDSNFYRIYFSLFFDKISSDTSGSNEENTVKPVKQQQSVEDRITSRFQQIVNGKNSGWIPWISENTFCPIVWVRTDGQSGDIIGASVETVTLLSRQIPLISFSESDLFHVELADSYLGKISGSGFYLKEGMKPLVVVEISRTTVPGWRVLGYLNPVGFSDWRNMALANSLLICAILMVIIAAGGMLFWLIRREIIIAGKKTTFVANVSHELKTPLTSIRMYSELLQQGQDKLSKEKTERYLNIIVTESERLSRLIANVLNFSRMEAGEKNYNPEKININKLIIELTDSYQHIFNEHEMKVDLDIPDTELNTVFDRDSLVQVMQNLIDNAIKYASDGKEITISLHEKNNTTQIHVMDRGKGVPLGERNKIFRKFYRTDNRLTAKTRGTGLGLVISRGLMRDQKGDLTYYPRPDGGSIFTITLGGNKNEQND